MLLEEMEGPSVRIFPSNLKPRAPSHCHKGRDILSGGLTKNRELEGKLRKGIQRVVSRQKHHRVRTCLVSGKGKPKLANSNLNSPNRTATQLNFIEHLSCTRHFSNCSPHIISFMAYNSLITRIRERGRATFKNSRKGLLRTLPLITFHKKPGLF